MCPASPAPSKPAGAYFRHILDGDAAARLRAMDWAACPLGPPECWSAPFLHAVELMLNAQAQICMFCGPELVALYNDAYAPAIGHQHPGAFGQPARDHWHEFGTIFEPLLRNVLTTGQTVQGQNYPFRMNRSGFMEEVYFDMSCNPVYRPDGAVEAVFCIVADRTQRVIDDRRLRTLQAISQTIVTDTVEACAASALDILARESSQDMPHAAIYLLDTRAGTLQCAGWYGVQPAETLIHFRQAQEQSLPSRMAAGAPAPSWRSLIGQALQNNTVLYGEARDLFPVLPALSSERIGILPLSVTRHTAGLLIAGKSRLYPPTAEYYRFFELIAAQVSTGFATALALREQHQRARILEQKVAAAIAEREISEARLRQAQKMEMIGKLTGGVAHDFNNLLHVIGGNLELAIHGLPAESPQRRRLTSALEAMQRGSRLASQLLAFGRQQPLAPQPVNPQHLLRTVADILQRTIGAGITLQTVIADDLWNIHVDRAQIEAALLNLVINARDAMDGQGRLLIEAANTVLDTRDDAGALEAEPGEYVTLSVTDTGCGMMPEVMARAYEPFFTTKPEGQGTGLGMSMVHGFVKQSGGDITIDSTPGKGTTIRLFLPRARNGEPPTRTAADSPASAYTASLASDPLPGGTETILAVEDEAAVRAIVIDTLEQLGYRVLHTGNAEDALSILRSDVRVDLLFTDIVMPGPLRGTDLASQVRQISPNTAILFTSGYTETAIQPDSGSCQPAHLLSKPYSRKALAQKIRAVLNVNQATASSLTPSRIAVGHTSHAGADTPAEQGRRLTILVTEDEPLIRMNLIDMLEELGHQALEAGDAEQALDHLHQRRPDILLTDISLPGLSGIDLAQRARQIMPHIGIVFASGYTDIAGMTDTLRESCVILSKPFAMEGLLNALDTALARRAPGS